MSSILNWIPPHAKRPRLSLVAHATRLSSSPQSPTSKCSMAATSCLPVGRLHRSAALVHAAQALGCVPGYLIALVDAVRPGLVVAA